MYAKVSFGYECGVPNPDHGERRALFGQVFSEWQRGIEVLQLWPLDFAMNTRENTTVSPLATLWRPTLSGVMIDAFGVSGVERIDLAGQRRWTIQRWLCTPVGYESARKQETERKAEHWRWKA